MSALSLFWPAISLTAETQLPSEDGLIEWF
jgi:hypothetical protein